jgi:hypothetical protein
VEKRNREYLLVSKRWEQQIREGRPVPRTLAAEARTWLDQVLSSGDRAAAKAAICTLYALRPSASLKPSGCRGARTQ